MGDGVWGIKWHQSNSKGYFRGFGAEVGLGYGVGIELIVVYSEQF